MFILQQQMQRLNLSVLVLKLWPKIIKHGLWIIPSRDTNEFIHKEAQPLEDELVKSWFSL
jgi:hypothetical protein